MPADPPDDRRDESPADRNADDGPHADDRDGAPFEGRDEPPSDDREEPARADGRDEGRRDDTPADGSDERRREDPADASNGDLLSSLLKALESLDRISGSDRRRGSGRRLDYDISIRSGLDALDAGSDDGRARSGRPGSGPAHSYGRPSAGRTRRRRQRRSPSSYRTEIRLDDEQLSVVADVAGADPETVAVGYDDGDLVVGVEGSEIERVDVPWPDPTANARVKNGILTVTLERGGEDRE